MLLLDMVVVDPKYGESWVEISVNGQKYIVDDMTIKREHSIICSQAWGGKDYIIAVKFPIKLATKTDLIEIQIPVKLVLLHLYTLEI